MEQLNNNYILKRLNIINKIKHSNWWRILKPIIRNILAFLAKFIFKPKKMRDYYEITGLKYVN